MEMNSRVPCLPCRGKSFRRNSVFPRCRSSASKFRRRVEGSSARSEMRFQDELPATRPLRKLVGNVAECAEKFPTLLPDKGYWKTRSRGGLRQIRESLSASCLLLAFLSRALFPFPMCSASGWKSLPSIFLLFRCRRFMTPPFVRRSIIDEGKSL